MILHFFVAVLAALRITEVITADKLFEPVRRRWPIYLFSCARCVSVWAGALVTITLFICPYANYPLALSWLYVVWVDQRAAKRLKAVGRELIVSVRDGQLQLTKNELTPEELFLLRKSIQVNEQA